MLFVEACEGAASRYVTQLYKRLAAFCSEKNSIRTHFCTLVKLRELFRNKLICRGSYWVCLIFSARIWRHPEENRLAEIDGEVITEHQLEAALGPQLSQLNQQM
jgi:hypothetical protein